MRETGSQLTILNQAHKYLESNSKSITQNFASNEVILESRFSMNLYLLLKGFGGISNLGKLAPVSQVMTKDTK